MSKVYFIGGSTLCGKAEIATRFLTLLPRINGLALQYVGTDSIRRVLWGAGLDEQEPALVQLHADRRAAPSLAARIAQYKNNPDRAVARQQAESEVVWRRGVAPLASANLDRGLPTLIEGVAIRPELLATCVEPHRAVIVGNNSVSDEYVQNVIANVRKPRSHWMRDWTDEQIETYVRHQVPAYSNRLRQDAAMHGYPYFDLSQGNHREVQQQAAELLATMEPIRPKSIAYG